MKSANWLGDNKVVLLEGGEDFYPYLFDCIASAEQEILIDIYTVLDDQIGRKFRSQLLEALNRGVSISLVFDGVGSFELPDDFFDELKSRGAEVVEYKAVRHFYRIRNVFSERLHRKLFVIDEKFGFVSGMNIGEEYLLNDDDSPRMDHAVYIEGPVVQDIRNLLIEFRQRVKKRWKRLFRLRRPEGKTPLEDLAPMRAALVIRDNFRYRKDLEKHFLRGVSQAANSIDIANAYFMPSNGFIKALREAAERGVKVRLILEGRAEYFWLKSATSRLYRRLLESGIEIYEYQPRLLHSKIALVDGEFVSVGSCNLDPISLFHNLEANLVVCDGGFAKEAKKRFDSLCKNSKKIDLAELNKLPWWNRLQAKIFYNFLRIMSDLFLGIK